MSGICSLTDTEKCYEQRGEILKVSAVRARLKELSRITGIQKAPVYPNGEPLFNTIILPGKKKKKKAELLCHQIYWCTNASLGMLETAEISDHIPDSVFKERNLSLVLLFSIVLHTRL